MANLVRIGRLASSNDEPQEIVLEAEKRTSISKPRRGKIGSLPNVHFNFEGEEEVAEREKKNGIDHSMKNVKISGVEAYAKSTTVLGKTFWLLLIIASSIAMLYELYRTIDGYFDGTVVTNFNVIPSLELDFPEVCICPSVDIQFLHNVMSEISEMISPRYDIDKSKGATECSSTFNDVDVNQLKIDHRIEDLFKSCSLNDLYEDVQVPCEKIVKSIFHADRGICFLASQGTWRQTVQGKGLMLTLNVSGKTESTCEISQLVKGVAVFVDRHYNLGSSESIFVKPGTLNKIDLKAQLFQFQNYKTGINIQPCVDADSVKLLYFNTSYSQALCHKECEMHVFLETCRCIPIMDQHFINFTFAKHATFCTGDQMINCVNSKIWESNRNMQLVQSCRLNCHQACTMWRYPMISSQHPLNAAKYAKHGKSVDSLIYLHISFANLEYELFEQQSQKTFDDMVSDIGGQINLWLGASMITLIQLPFAISVIIGWALYGNVKKKASKNIAENSTR